ncbi:GTP-binding protein [Accumulibacter sp.]|uniref:CobW family GTP-binding protein n=1 Tax=Accumulibacter sp. TaxID=2053492 RepID=UPI002625E81E|nr:GTP-binding protein [Accumulibacter sp.]
MNPTLAAPLPVTLLSGFLGAGKTTVLNALLDHADGRRFAVVENEFGAVNIDSQLVSRSQGGIIELTNGCVCCTVNADLVRGLQDLAAQRASGRLAFDWIIVETTGLADPGAVAQTFFAAPELRDDFMLDGIVVVVDALHAGQQLDQHLVVQRQVGFADRLLLAKCDLVDPATIVDLSERLRGINPRAPQQSLQQGRAEPGSLLGIGGFKLDASLLAADVGIPSPARFIPVAGPAGVRWSRRPAHDDEISSFLLEAGEVDLDGIAAFVQSLIDELGDQLLRYKGILAVPDEDRKLIFQGVQRVAGFDYGAVWVPGEARRSRIVLIGKRLPEVRLREEFRRVAEAAGVASRAESGAGRLG